MDKKRIIREIVANKRLVRRLQNSIDLVKIKLSLCHRQLRKMPIFSTVDRQRQLVELDIADHEMSLEDLMGLWEEFALELAVWIRRYDDNICYNSHEQAQLLSMSEGSYHNFISRVALKCSLEDASILNAETFSEKESNIGDKCKRDHPMLDAVEFKGQKELKESPCLRKEVSDYINSKIDDARLHYDLVLKEGGLFFVKSKADLSVVI